MTPEENTPSSDEGLSLYDQARLRNRVYIPPQLHKKIEDALKAMALEAGVRDTKAIDKIKIEFWMEGSVDKPIFMMDYFGYANKPREFTFTVASLKNYVRDNPECSQVSFKEADDARTVMRSPELKPMVNALIEGFINKYCDEHGMPDYKLNFDAIMEKYTPKPKTSWVEAENGRRQSSSEDSGTPGGGLGGGK